MLLFSSLSILMVSIMALVNPQQVMDLVQVKLGNTDAFSSIRGVYGGVGITIVTALLYYTIKDIRRGLQFVALLWGSYAVSRIITSLVEGPLGAFGTQWLVIESSLCMIALLLLFIGAYKPLKSTGGQIGN